MTAATPLVEIASTGRYLPDRVVTNRDMESIVETSDEWIVERTGIRERRLAPPGMTAAHMGAGAARIAMERAGVAPEDVDILIVSTATPDRWLPATACDIQALIGARKAVAFDITAACSGFIYALTLAEGHLSTGRGEIALVIATEKMSSIVDWEDRSTCVLFGDGAGAVIVRKSSEERGILGTHHQSDGNLLELLYRPAGGAAIPMDEEVLRDRTHLLRMSGPEVFNQGDCPLRGPAHGESVRQRRPIRKHELGNHSGGDGRGDRRGAITARHEATTRRVRGWVDVGRHGCSLVGMSCP